MYSIDRFEGHIAIIEDDDGKFIEVDRSLLPANVKEGSILESPTALFSLDENHNREKKPRQSRTPLFGEQSGLAEILVFNNFSEQHKNAVSFLWELLKSMETK